MKYVREFHKYKQLVHIVNLIFLDRKKEIMNQR